MDFIKSDLVPLHGGVVSMQGGRPENQDDQGYIDTPVGFFFIVCDGMGGGPGGKTASYIVKTEMARVLCGCTPQTPRDHALKMATAAANDALEERMRQVPSLVGMGSTYVAVLISGQSAFVAHAGDSRCYLLRGKSVLFRTRDHSLVGELVEKKALTEEQARVSPQSNVITRGLGSTSNHVPAIEEVPYRRGDRFVLCTDGVWGSMPHPALLKALTARTDVQTAVQNLSVEVDRIGFANGGGHDNHTLAIIEMEADSLLQAPRPRWMLAAVIAAAAVVLATGAALLFMLAPWKKPVQKTTHATHVPAPSPSQPQQQESQTSHTADEQTSADEGVADDTDQQEPQEKKGTFPVLDAFRNGVKGVQQQEESGGAAEQGDAEKQPKAENAKEKPAKNAQAAMATATPEQLMQQLINYMQAASRVKEVTQDSAARKMDEYQKTVTGTYKQLLRKELPARVSNYLKTTFKTEIVDDKHVWQVDKSQNAYIPLRLQKMEKSISKLSELCDEIRQAKTAPQPEKP